MPACSLQVPALVCRPTHPIEKVGLSWRKIPMGIFSSTIYLIMDYIVHRKQRGTTESCKEVLCQPRVAHEDGAGGEKRRQENAGRTE